MITVNPGATLCVDGDSISVGASASNYGTLGFAARLAGKYGLNLQNNAVSGTGARKATLAAFANYQPFGTARNAVYLWAPGHNDGLYCGANTPKKVAGELISYLCHVWAATSVAPSSGTITKTGTWNVGDASLGDKSAIALGGNIVWTSAVGSKLSGSVSGDSLVVRCFAGPGPAGNRVGRFSVNACGLVATYDGDEQSDGSPINGSSVTHHALVMRGLGAGSHSFELECTGNAGPLYIDAIETLQRPNQAAPVLVLKPPRPSNYSLGNGTSSPAVYDAIDAAIAEALQIFAGYPVALVSTNDYLDPAHLCGDHEHPTDAGHLDIERACSAQIEPKTPLGWTAWNPTLTGWTFSGAYTVDARYVKDGAKLSFDIRIDTSPHTMATTLMVSKLSLPPDIKVAIPSAALCLNCGNAAYLGAGLINTDNQIYLPTITTTTGPLTISGSYLER